MYYQNESAIQLSKVVAERCKVHLKTPAPNLLLQSYALSLDKDDMPAEDQQLGKKFAQEITFVCQ
jgi:ABC-type uncharacterized transport system substrate-binding protein